MRPKDIKSLLDWIRKNRDIDSLISNLITQWGPADRVMLSANFLPPRLVDKNEDTLDKVHFRTVAAVDGTRHAPAQMVDGGEIFGKIHYKLGNSDLARQITGPDYDGIVKYVNARLPMAAAAKLIGIFDTFIVQGLVEHDELANWDAIVFNKVTRRGDNGYYEYLEGPDLSGHRVSVGGDWTDPDYDPWFNDIIPRIRFLTRLGYTKAGIRLVTSDAVIQTLADHPATLRRSYAGTIAYPGQTIEEAASTVTDDDVARVFRKLGVQAPLTHDLRIQTKTGEARAYPEDHLTMIASTGQSEEVLFNVDNVADVRIVRDTLGFNGIGTANGKQAPGRQSATEANTDQKDAHIFLQGWQSTGPVIMQPTAITDLKDIDLAS